MKYTHFCMPQGNQRVCFHFSHFLLTGLGNNEKTPRSCAGIGARVTPFVHKPQSGGIPPQLLAPAERNQHRRARLRGLLHFPKVQVVCISPVLAPALSSSFRARQLEHSPRPQEEMTNPRHWELAAQNPHARWVIQQSDRKEFVWHCPLLVSGLGSTIYPSLPRSLQLFFL